MYTEQPILTTSIKAAADLSTSKNLLIGFDGKLCVADAKPLGVLAANTDFDELAPVHTNGIVLVKSGAAFAVGDHLKCDSAGKVIKWATSGAYVGYALDAASGADELIRVLLSD